MALLWAGCSTSGDVPTSPTLASVSDAELQIPGELKEVRRRTAPFRDLDNALDAGFELGNSSSDFPAPVVTGCVQHPTAGAMGYHYFDVARYDDPAVNLLEPEVLIYATNPAGERVLVAVEWVVKKETWEAAGNTAPPVINGRELHILNPALNWYLLHAWIWKENPAGVYADWNPDVTCP
jgi:hypothetical protein